MTVRALYRPERIDWPATKVAPQGMHKDVLESRNALKAFLDANLAAPVSFTGEQLDARAEEALNTMTMTERVIIEIDMQERLKHVHSFDYDPLR